MYNEVYKLIHNSRWRRNYLKIIRQEALNLKINNNVFYLASIVFSILTIVSLFLSFPYYGDSYIVMLFLGFTQLFSGLYQVKLSQCLDSKETHKGNKAVGIFSIIVGLFIIIIDIVKLMF